MSHGPAGPVPAAREPQGDGAQRSPADDGAPGEFGDLPAALMHPVDARGAGHRRGRGRGWSRGVHGPCGVQVAHPVQAPGGGAREQRAQPGARARTDDGADPGRAGGTVELERLQRRLPVVADVDVVRAGRDRRAEYAGAEPVEGADGGEHGVDVGERGAQAGGVGDVDPVRGRVGQGGGELRGRVRVAVRDDERVDAGEAGEGAGGAGAHRSRTEDGDPHRAARCRDAKSVSASR